MEKTIAYIFAVWSGREFTDTDQAVVYCCKVYLANFTSRCPILCLLNGIDMVRELLRRSYMLIVCGDDVDKAVKNDIAMAQQLGITVITLDRILKFRSQGHVENH